MVGQAKRSGEGFEVIARHADPAEAPELAVVECHRFREDAMNVQPDDSHLCSRCCRSREPAGYTATTDPRS